MPSFAFLTDLEQSLTHARVNGMPQLGPKYCMRSVILA